MRREYWRVMPLYLCSAMFYIAAIVGYINDTSNATVFLCLGSVFLCLGSSRLTSVGKRLREDEEHKEKLERELREDETEDDDETDDGTQSDQKM